VRSCRPRFFFEPPGADGFVDRVGQHPELRPDCGNIHSRIEHPLDFFDALRRQLVPLPGHRRTEKSSSPFLPQLQPNAANPSIRFIAFPLPPASVPERSGCLNLYSGTSEVGTKTTVMVGWGQGRGTEISGQGWAWGGDGTNNQRWGTNKVDWSGTVSGYQAFATRFSPDQGVNEYSATLRDSGSPIFQLQNGKWQLVGITTGVEVNGQSLYNPEQYTVTVRISAYQSQILAIIPEPSTFWIALPGLGSLLLYRLHRRHALHRVPS
jgi:hypothetical protein